MSGIVGSRHNIRGSGLVGSLGTDGQVFTSAGAGTGAVFEDAAGGGSWTLIKSLTASGNDDLSFVNGTSDVVIDTTYNVYCFTFSNIHGSIINPSFQFNGSTDTGSNYNVSKTQFANRSWKCSGSSGAPTNDTGEALFQATTPAHLNNSIGIDADECVSGQLWLYNLGSDTFVKFYECHASGSHSSDCLYKWIISGEIEATDPVDAIQFSFSTGTLDAGVISLYGLAK